jgi:alpha/beta superfamily hydrolase
VTSVQLTTGDGHLLEGDVADRPDGGAPLGNVVLCHPHPRLGGDRFNVVIEALFSVLPAAGFRTLRFDFRRGHGDGVAERLDVVAALDVLAALGPEPMVSIGYSFGAAVALGTADGRVRAIVAIAPPLSAMPVRAPEVATLVLCPRHDQFCPPETIEPIVRDWDLAELAVVESADHFLAGRTAAVADEVVEWLRRQL